MQTQTQSNGYDVRYLPNGEYSLVDDNGVVKPLLINGTPRLRVDWLHILFSHNIVAEYKDKFYGFTADLTPIALEIEGEPRVAFDYFGIDQNGISEL